MALMLLQVLVLGVFAAAAGDVPLAWYGPSRTLVPCALPGAARAPLRRPLPLHGADEAPPYSWRRDGVNFTQKVLANGTLELRRRDAVDGVYQCAATLPRGVLLGYPVRMQAAHLDKFSKHPVNTTALRGQPVAVPCVVSSGPPATISWLRDDQDLPADNRYYLLKNQLLITDVKDSDAGVYRCIASNTFLNKTRLSHGGRLHVAAPEPQDLMLLPTYEDQELIVPEGGDAVLPCLVVGWPRPEPEVTWEHSSGGQVRPLSGGPVLVLSELEVAQDGVYTCRVPGRPDLQKTYNVTVSRPVNITLPPVSKEAMRASTIRFNCTATGHPKPNVTWYKDGSPLAITGTIGLLKAVSKEDHKQLVINSISSKDAGVYQCFASNNVTMASSWAVLTVTGPTAPAPQDIFCAPVGAMEVAVRWSSVPTDVLAYTVHTTAQEPGGTHAPLGQPVRDNHTVIAVPIPLAPYRFQVRAYIMAAKGAATDISDFVVCQGQGVPINLSKLNTTVLVSWKKFAQQYPGVVEWVVQSRLAEQPEVVTNVTLDGSVTNYTLDLPEDGDLQVRVLGTRSRPWLQQNLTAVPWRSLDLSTGDLRATPRNLVVTEVRPRGFTVRWETDDLSPRKYKFLVCATKIDDPATGEDICQKSEVHSATIENLQPGSDYEVRVETRIQDLEPAETVLPYRVSTLAEEATAISYKFQNATAVRVSWSGPGRHAVRYRQQLPPPLGDWAALETDGNTVLLTGIDPNAETYVEVISQEKKATKHEITIPPQIKDLDAKDLSYVYTSNGITVSWASTGPRVVKFAQNITQPLEKWMAVNVTGSHVQLAGLDRRLPTYVTVTAAGTGQVLTIPPAPPAPSVAVGVALGCAACVLLLLAAAALLVWRRRKMAASPVRSRRRTMSPTEGHQGESSEMKNIGGRLANGGAAGEPLLNGHVHITENPTSKTPNGKMKKGRYSPLDVSRHSRSADATLETVLEADASASSSLLLAAGRAELDMSRARDLPADDSFSKLPDDNMNSEITRSSEFTLDNSKIQPTLQPNG